MVPPLPAVIPAKAGIQHTNLTTALPLQDGRLPINVASDARPERWIPAFAGMTAGVRGG